MCGALCCHLHWLAALFKRGDTRAKFDIRGDGCTDCLVNESLCHFGIWTFWQDSNDKPIGFLLLLPLHTRADGDRS